MNWESLDWEVLDRLRETFLTDAKSAGPYWHTVTDLECYNHTFGERIGWKWDAVLRELRQRGWSPPPGATVLDWGCGSGIAGRRVLDFFGASNFTGLQVSDHSPLAVEFARHHARRAFPGLPVGAAEGDGPIGVLVLSHVLNELDATAQAGLRALVGRAESILWVEPGTHAASRALGQWREELVTSHPVVAPCTHRAACGILATGNERHWCHFFAAPPPGILADSGWVKFGQRAGIDLRSLPYSFLVMDRRAAGSALVAGPRPYIQEAGHSRVIGEPRLYKGFARVYNCDAGGVHDLMLQKRDAPEIFKALKRGDGPLLQSWTHANGRITRPAASSDATSPEN